MDGEDKKMLQDALELAQENNKILHSMRRSMRVGRIMSLLYWVLILGIAVGSFYFLQPYLDKVITLYNSASSTLKSLK